MIFGMHLCSVCNRCTTNALDDDDDDDDYDREEQERRRMNGVNLSKEKTVCHS